MKRLLSVLSLVLVSGTLFGSAEMVKKTVLGVHEAMLAGDFSAIEKFYHPEHTLISGSGKRGDIKHIRNIISVMNAMKKAVKADSKLIDIVELYALIRRKPLSDEQRNTVLSIQDSETGRTRADTLRRELKGQYDSMRRKMTASLKSCRFASVMVNGRNAHCVFYMNSMNDSTPQKVSVDLVKVKNRWLILKSVTENLPE